MRRRSAAHATTWFLDACSVSFRVAFPILLDLFMFEGYRQRLCSLCSRYDSDVFFNNFEAIHATDDFQNYSICFRGQLKNAKSAFRVRRRDRIDARTLRQSSHTHTPGKTIGGPTHLQNHFLLNDGSTKNVRKSYFPIGFEA